MSLSVYSVIAAYAIQMGQILVLKKDPIINTSVNKSQFSAQDIVSFEDWGFKIAFGVMDYSTSKVLDDPAHVRCNVYLEERKDLQVIEETKLSIHKCTVEDAAKFYPVADSNARFLSSLLQG